MVQVSEKKVPCEVYSRVVGYIRPVQNWNKGKRQEWRERETYRVDKAVAGVEKKENTLQD